MHTFGGGKEDIQDMFDSVMDRNLPEKDRIFLDAEQIKKYMSNGQTFEDAYKKTFNTDKLK
jgi:hypothetical protein